MASLEKKGWLLPKDSLKTELIFSVNSKRNPYAMDSLFIYEY